MAIVMSGKERGRAIKIHQFSNDWVMSEEGSIFKITTLEFSDEEKIRINRANDLKQCGMMFEKFKWVENRLVKKE